jgi:hypothetical protein
MKTKSLLALALSGAFIATSAFAGPGPVGPRSTTARALPTTIDCPAMPGCPAPPNCPMHTGKGVNKHCKHTMTIQTSPRLGGSVQVNCDAFAKVRPSECRIACR